VCGDSEPPGVVPDEVQAQLPLTLSLGNLCRGAETPPELAPELRGGARLMIRELRRHPDWLVTYTYYYEDAPEGERKEITVRKLAEEQLADLRSGSAAGLGKCSPDLQREIEDALAQPDIANPS
jgi:hypothetical protein